jgi:hypothetical protein
MAGATAKDWRAQVAVDAGAELIGAGPKGGHATEEAHAGCAGRCFVRDATLEAAAYGVDRIVFLYDSLPSFDPRGRVDAWGSA